MFKLVTETERKSIRREYRLRRFGVVLAALTVLSVVGVVGLSPSYILSNLRHTEALEQMRVLKNLEAGDEEAAFRGRLSEANKRLRLLSSRMETAKPSTFVEKVIGEKEESISLTTFSFRADSESKVELMIGGLASNRQALVAFRDRLGELEAFGEITLPISDLAKDRDINFQIKLSPK